MRDRVTSRSPCAAAIAAKGSSHTRNCGESSGESTRNTVIAAIGASPSSTPVPRGLGTRREDPCHSATPARTASTSRPLTTLVTSPTRHAPRSMCGVDAPDAAHERADRALELPTLGAAERQHLHRTVDAAPRDPCRGARPRPTATNAPSARQARRTMSMGTSTSGPELGEAHDGERRAARVLMSTANERDAENGEEHREKVEPEVDEWIEQGTEGRARGRRSRRAVPTPTRRRPRSPGRRRAATT